MFEELALSLPQITDTAPIAVDLPALINAHASTLFRVAHSLLRNRAEAEDVVQDTFIRVLEHRQKLPLVRDLRPWLIRITWNLALDRRRRLKPDQADDLFLQSLTAPGSSPETFLAEAQQSRLVLRALDRLPALERQALLLAAMDELSTAEIATAMGKTESAIRALVHRARTRLRARLEKGGKR